MSRHRSRQSQPSRLPATSRPPSQRIRLSSLPDLGPVRPGGKSVLDQKLTHNTGGIPLYPAFDDGFSAGTDVIAPEKLTVTKASSSSPGDAFYAEGVSGIRYWFGHLVSAPAVGKTFSKGAKMGDVVATNVGGGPHVHTGLNCEAIIGKGKQLKCGANGDGTPEYTYYAKTVGEQLVPYYVEEEGVYEWLDDWLLWDLQGQYWDPPMKRPAAAPSKIPEDAQAVSKQVSQMLKRQGSDKCFEKWMAWKDGGEKGPKPDCCPDKIYEEWQEARARLR